MDHVVGHFLCNISFLQRKSAFNRIIRAEYLRKFPQNIESVENAMVKEQCLEIFYYKNRIRIANMDPDSHR